MRRLIIATALSVAFAIPTASFAKTLKWASQGDILTLDPHSQNESAHLALSLMYQEECKPEDV